MRFSIITPVHNGQEYIAETIESVLSQEGDFEIEYIIADGASTDGTVDIISRFERLLDSGQFPVKCKKASLSHFSEKDAGMYDALKKGLDRANGDVFAYINSDDKYLPGAFAAANRIFSKYTGMEWIKGINTTIDESGNTTESGDCLIFKRNWLAKGIYGRNAYFVHQDSVFWRRSLWENANPDISGFKLAGDYVLWIAFAAYAPLWSFNRRVSAFREHPGQLSDIMMAPYKAEQDRAISHDRYLEKRVALFFSLIRSMKLNVRGWVTQILSSVMFPSEATECYIDFDTQGEPMIKKAHSYII